MTTATLSNQAATLAVIRTDTGLAVTPPAVGAAMTNLSAGIYYYDLADPAAGLTYSWWVKAVYNGASHYFNFTTQGTFAGPEGTYADLSDLQDRFGTDNIYQWADLDNVGPDDWATNGPVLARIQRALDWADDEIDKFFYGSIYTVPFTPVVSCLTEWAAIIAGSRLFQGRGMRKDDGGPAQDYSAMLQMTYEEMGQVRGGYPFQIKGVGFNSATTISVTVLDQFTNVISTGANTAP